MKEKRKGPIGRAAGLAEGVAATVRRLQREREPRVLVYDETGYARLVQPNGRGYERLLETAERMVALVSEAEAEAKPRLVRRTEKAEEGGRGARARPKGTTRRRSRGRRAPSARAERRSRARRRTERTGGAKKPRASRTRRSTPKDDS